MSLKKVFSKQLYYITFLCSLLAFTGMSYVSQPTDAIAIELVHSKVSAEKAAAFIIVEEIHDYIAYAFNFECMLQTFNSNATISYNAQKRIRAFLKSNRYTIPNSSRLLLKMTDEHPTRLG